MLHFHPLLICIIALNTICSSLEFFHGDAAKISSLVLDNIESPCVSMFMLKRTEKLRDMVESIIKDLSQRYIPVYVDNDVEVHLQPSSNFNIFVSLDVESFLSFIHYKNANQWKLSSSTILLLLCDSCIVTNGFFEETFRLKMINVAIIVSESNLAITYNPFSKIRAEHDFLSSTYDQLFPDLLADLMQFPLRVARFDEPPRSFLTKAGLAGVDFHVMSEVLARMNASYTVFDTTSSTQRTKMYQALEDGTASLTFNSFLYLSINYHNSSSDYIYPITVGSLNLLVPSPCNFHSHFSLIEPFRPNSLIAIFVIISAFILIWYKMKVYLGHSAMKFVDIVFDTYRISLGIPLFRKITLSAERRLVIGYVLAMFVIMSEYQTVLISMISSQKADSHLTLSYVNESKGMKIVIPRIYDVSTHLRSYYLRGLMNNDIELADVNIWELNRTPPKPDVAYLVPRTVGQEFERSSANFIHGRRIYDFINHGLLISILANGIERNSIYRQKISMWVQRIREAHLIKHFWLISVFETRKVYGFYVDEDFDVENMHHRVTFESLKPVFSFLLIGGFVATVVFVVEIIWKTALCGKCLTKFIRRK